MTEPNSTGFDGTAAVTRSLLGWGAVAGVFYLALGVIRGLTREGFSFTEHALSLLMLGDGGWVQSANLIVSGAMVVAAALGFDRAMSPGKGARSAGLLVGVYGAALIGSGIFPPDPVDRFPDPASTAEATTGGVMHVALGGIGFLALAAAIFVVAGWLTRRGDLGAATRSRVAGAVVLIGFLGGAALSTGSAGVALLWIAVIAGWVWLAITSLGLYGMVPHPDLDERVAVRPER
jgi:hypothetical membrane protein